MNTELLVVKAQWARCCHFLLHGLLCGPTVGGDYVILRILRIIGRIELTGRLT
jgi:hypothetical protein